MTTASDPTRDAGPAVDGATVDEELGLDDGAWVDSAPAGPVPIVAVVGRPNVGKSTLVNRILGRRAAVVQDIPGITRDRVAYDANWSGHAFTLLDTGGWDPAAKGFAGRIAAQAEIGMQLADAVLFVVDASVGATDVDEAVASVLRRSKKPVMVAANKADDQRSTPSRRPCGRSAWASPSPSPRCMGGGQATCSTRC